MKQAAIINTNLMHSLYKKRGMEPQGEKITHQDKQIQLKVIFSSYKYTEKEKQRKNRWLYVRKTSNK